MGVPSFRGSRGLVTEGRRHETRSPSSLSWPSGSRPVSGAGRGRGQSWEEGVAGRGELCGQGAALRAQLRSAVRASDPQLTAPQPLPKMIPAVVLLLLLLVEQAAALGEPQLCYILDAILFLYGIVLTLLYCRLKLQVRKAAVASYEKSDGIYTGLSTRNQETYETLKHEKPPQ
ncbi:high affinity immunoglobulin epsilon receptor subunit gamma [Hippopotamus amphibius kiboko]|uniref:high affinity immunoglobulin epsilon receptor subunit gamma n=1 Tax=Hippopotamus amphibius kiboko TaxID=575201 RepID=UPI002597A514|nr:high affinity immunoglobulin epsilon receptor subunit gamma [Hippopotamus amphibius kiboko]